ncbi:extensin-like domain-containing protein [Tranquillimonas alkanivorans]|uniref:Uncharacterized conserved protein n=1 Tax=Tranquillimonas alkanivorans TaxID=441119 RepID=A0A1I5NCJ4_9RHOB|nr:extensin family protein [Tranquillimonas alkanivorans]SFP18941.1 Uncharacterized conserved protein [Tranquillimonas alkanivorans]
MRAAAFVCAAALFAGQAMAAAPEVSLRPVPRWAAMPAVAAPPGKPAETVAPAQTGLRRSLRPRPRPGRASPPTRTTAIRPPAQQVPVSDRVGAVCRDRAIQGVELRPIAGRLTGCGVSDPVRVTSVAGVTLSQPSVMGCSTAKALKDWVEKGATPAIGPLGGGIESFRVAAHYVCRSVNDEPDTRISQHGMGQAIDISAIELQNGVTITVEDGWGDPIKGKILRRMHRSACGPFRTVLGPAADRHHVDHFHFDTASYRRGTYCR